MHAPVPVRRLAYRLGYRALQAVWLFTRPQLNGVKCLITDEDRVLLVRHTYGRGWWDLPGGAIGRGELPRKAAHREMTEELGLQDVDWEPVCQIQVNSSHRRDQLHCFRAELQAPELRLDLGELREARWFRRVELPYDLAPHVIPIVARTTVRHPN